ncbi:MAG: glycosyltransferase [Chloroflexi bacterium]|nr:glycosyltransferase [Chloroflexota bacterium]
MRRALLVIAKRPAAGLTKTRLSPPLSPAEAALLYEGFLRDTLDLVRQVPHVTRLVAYLPREAHGYFSQLAPDFQLVLQAGKDLGERLDNALTDCLTRDFDQAVIMDSDSPTLPAPYLAQAFDCLCESDVVFGPCEDGGYYLLGLNRPQPRLLREVEMSTSHVLTDSLAIAQQQNLRVSLLPTWYDVDTVQELDRLEQELVSAPHGLARYTHHCLQRYPVL